MLDYDVQRPRFSLWSQLAILLFLSGIGLLVGSIVSIPIATAYLHVPLQQLQDALLKSENANLSRLLQFVTTFFFMAFPSFIFARIMNQKPFEYIGFNSALSGKQVFIIIGIVLFGLAVSGALSTVNEMIPISKSAAQYFKGLETEYNKEVLAIADMKTVQDYIVSLIMIALLPAIFEEMLFRGSLQPIMINIFKSPFTGILITSILFSAIHMSYYGFLPRLALGLMIGYLFYFSKNLWLSSIMHFLYNAFGVTQLYALSRQGLLNQNALSDDSFPLYYGLFAAAALYILFIFFKKESEVVISMHNIKKM
ncbi:MAG: CPBP family intramembrane glutamic endopeptidase [Parafilimonas sp.]